MSNVTLEIGGRSYAVACADGQEAHVLGLGRAIDAKLAMSSTPPGQAEIRTLLFAALLMADECHEMKQSRGQAAVAPAPDPALGEALERIAGRLENCATRLEGSSLNS